MWQNNGLENNIPNSIKLKAYDIVKDNLEFIKELEIKKVKNNFSLYSPTIKHFEKDIPSDVFVDNKTGVQSESKINKQSIFNENIVGYLRATSYNLSGFSGFLTRTITKDALEQCYGYYLREDDFLSKLPLFTAKAFPETLWYEKDIYFTTSDGGLMYLNDLNFLKKCLIWTCLSFKNKSCSFIGTDGRYYRNELCFDGDVTASSKALNKLLLNKDITLNECEKDLLAEYKELINEVSKKDVNGINLYEEYNPDFSYGIFQIANEIDIKIVVGYDKNGNEKYGPKYGDLHNRLNDFRKKVQLYYNEYIISDLFKYELLK